MHIEHVSFQWLMPNDTYDKGVKKNLEWMKDNEGCTFFVTSDDVLKGLLITANVWWNIMKLVNFAFH